MTGLFPERPGFEDPRHPPFLPQAPPAQQAPAPGPVTPLDIPARGGVVEAGGGGQPAPGGIGPPTPAFLPSGGPQEREMPELITDEMLNDAVQQTADGDGKISWGKVMMALGKGVKGLMGSPLGVAGIGAAVGAIGGGGLSGATSGALGAVAGKYEGMSEGEEHRQKYATARAKTEKALNDANVTNLKFLHNEQIKANRYDQAAKTMRQISALTGVSIDPDEITAMYEGREMNYKKDKFQKDMELSLDGIFGAEGEVPDQEALNAWQAKNLNDDAVVRVLASKKADEPVTQGDRDRANRALHRHIGSYGFEAQQAYSKAEHENYMNQAAVESQFVNAFWGRFGAGMKQRGLDASNNSVTQFLGNFSNDPNHTPNTTAAGAMYGGLDNPKKNDLLKDSVRHLFVTGQIDNIRAVMNAGRGTSYTNAEVVTTILGAVVSDDDMIMAMKVVQEQEALAAPGAGATPTPGAGPAAPAPAPGAPRPGVAGPPAPTVTPAGLEAAIPIINDQALADRVITGLMDNPDLANAESPEDMLLSVSANDPTLKQAMSNKAVQQQLAHMFGDTSKYKKFVTPGTPEHDLITAQRGGSAPGSWITGENLLSKGERVKRARARVADADEKDKAHASTTKDLLAHWRSDDDSIYSDTLTGGDPSKRKPWAYMDFQAGFKQGESWGIADDILKGEPEYDEILQTGIPEKQALDLLKEALLTQKPWRDSEANPLMRSGEGLVQSKLRKRLEELRATPSSTGAVATAGPSAPVTPSPPPGGSNTIASGPPGQMPSPGGGPSRGPFGGEMTSARMPSGSDPGAAQSFMPSPKPVTTDDLMRESPAPTEAEGNVPQRRNNPGNIKSGGVGDQWAMRKPDGSLLLDDDGHLQFATPEDGFKAMEADVTAKISGNSPATRKKLKKDNAETVDELGKVYAEDPNWSSNVKSILKRDHDIDAESTELKLIPIAALVDSISKAEGYMA